MSTKILGHKVHLKPMNVIAKNNRSLWFANLMQLNSCQILLVVENSMDCL